MQNFQLNLSAAESQAYQAPEKYSTRQRLLSASVSLAMTGSASVTAAMANGSPQWATMNTGANATRVNASGFQSHLANTGRTSASGFGTSAMVHAAAAAVTGTTPTAATVNLNSGFSSFTNHSLHQARSVFSTAALQQSWQTTKNVNTALATQANGASDVNLASANPIFQAGGLAGFHQLTLDIGGKATTINFDTKLTGAELVAAQQVLSGGTQQLVLNAKGVATGGTFDLSTSTISALNTAVGGSLNSLVVSKGVNAVDSLASLNLGGSLINLGSITVGALQGATQTTDTISATNIFNGYGGTIASASVLSSLTPTSIALNASQLFYNNGTVSSAGTLSISAPTIVNTFADNIVHATTTTPTLTAVQNVNLTSQNVTNTGLISSTAGNVNFYNGGGDNNIAVTNAGGTIQALTGNINFNDPSYTGAGNVTLSGGDFLSKQLNFNAGYGAIEANIGEVTGEINGTAGAAHVTTATDNMNLGDICVSGDPTYYNTAGDITISGALTGTPDLALIASRNIIANGGSLSTNYQDITGGNGKDGGNILLIAGANFTTTGGSGSQGPDTSSTITVNNLGSTSGGFIDLSGNYYVTGGANTGLTKIDASGDAVTGKGGSITMIAYKGTGTTAQIEKYSGGMVATADPNQTGAHTIESTGGLGGGAVTLMGNGGQLFLQSVDAGSITINGATPTGTLTVKNGAITGGTGITMGTLAPVQILSTGTLTATANAGNTAATGNITINNGGTTEITYTNATGLAGSTTTGNLNVTSTGIIFVDALAQANNVTIKSTGSEIDAAAIVTAGAAGVVGVNNGNGGDAGNINLQGGTGVFVNYLDASGGGGAGGSTDGAAGGAGGKGGTITLTALNDNIQVFPLTDSSGNVAPGQINVSGGGGGGGAGSLNGTGGAGGAGGTAGTVVISTPYSFIGAVQTKDSTGNVTTNPTIVAYDGGSGGAGGSGGGVAAGGGGGGGSYGGAGGGGAAFSAGANSAVGGGGGGGTAGGGGGGGSTTGSTGATGGGGSSSSGSGGSATAGAGGLGTPVGGTGHLNTDTTAAGAGGDGGLPTGLTGGGGTGGVYTAGGVHGGVSSGSGSAIDGSGAFIGTTSSVSLTVGDKVGTSAAPVVIDTANLTVTVPASTTSAKANIFLGTLGNQINLQNISIGGGTFSESAPFGSITVGTGGIKGASTVTLGAESGVAVNNAITATKTITILTAPGDTSTTAGDITGTGVLTAPTVVLASDLGNITATAAATSISANAGGKSVDLTLQATSGKVTTLLASSVLTDGGTFTVTSPQQLNVSGITDLAGIVSLTANVSTAIGLNITGVINVGTNTGVAGGTVNLTTTYTGTGTGTGMASMQNTKAITAANININAGGNVGSSSKPFLTNTLTKLAITETSSGLSTAAVYIKDSNTSVGGFELTGASTNPGASISVSTAAQKLQVDNLDFANVTLTNSSTAIGSTAITLNAGGAASVIGNGNGVVSITTANVSIEQTAGATSGIKGKTITLKSTAGNIGGAGAIVVTSPVVTATATKLNVNLSDTVALSLNAGAAGQKYTVTAPGLTVAGAITGLNIGLTSTGTMTLNANVGAASSQTVTLKSTGNVTQSAKAVISGGTVDLEAAANGISFGTATQNIVTKAGTSLLANNTSSTTGNSFYINQNGKATLGASASGGASLLQLTDATALSVVGNVNFQTVNITDPSLTVASGGKITATNLTITAPVVNIAVTGGLTVSSNANFLSGSSLAITGVSGGLALTSGGTLTLGGVVGTKTTTSITLGDKTGANNPITAALDTGVAKTINIHGTGNFTTLNTGSSPVIEASANSGVINFQAANLVTVGASNPLTSVVLKAGGTTGGSINMSLLGTQAVTLDDNAASKTPANFVLQTGGGAGASSITVTTAGNLTVNSGGVTFNNNSSLSLVSAKALLVDNILSGTPNTITTLNLGSGATTAFVVNGATTNGTVGNISATNVAINAAGPISTTSTAAGVIAANNLSLANTKGTLVLTGNAAGTSFTASNTLELTAKSGITLGDSKTGANNPLEALLTAHTLSDLEVNTGGNFTSDITTFQTKTMVTGGTVSITAGNIVTTSATTNPTLTPIIIDASGATNAGTVVLNLTGTQAVNLQNSTVTKGARNYVVQDLGTGSSGSVTVKANGALTIVDAAGLSLQGQSSGTLTDLTLYGAKGLAILDAGVLKATGISNLNVGSGATKTLVLGIDKSSISNSGNGIVGNTIGAINSFVVNSPAGVFVNNSTNVVSNSLEFDTKTFTNNGTVDGSSTGTLSFGNVTTPIASLTVGAGPGSYNNIKTLNINATGVVDLSNLAPALNGKSAFKTANITTAGALTVPALTVASGGSINISAGSITSKASTPIVLTADTVTLYDKAALSIGSTAKGNVNVVATDATVTSGGVLTFNTAATYSGSGNLSGSSVVLNASVTGGTLAVASTSASGAITTKGTSALVSDNLTIANTNTKLATTATRISNNGTVKIGDGSHLGAVNLVNVTSANTGTAISQNGGVTAFSYTGGNNPTSLNSITTTSGGINVTNVFGNLTLNAGSILSTTGGGITLTDGASANTISIGNNAQLLTNAGSILLQNLNAASGLINVGTGVTMHGSGTAAGVGQVSLVIGPLPTAKQLALGTIPTTNIPTYITTGGSTITFGNTLSTAGATNTINSAGTGNVLFAEGRNIVFSGGIGTNITLQGNDKITADPPIGATTPSVIVPAASTSMIASPVSNASTVSSTPEIVSAAASLLTLPTSNNALTGVSNLATINAMNASSLESTSAATSNLNSTEAASDFVAGGKTVDAENATTFTMKPLQGGITRTVKAHGHEKTTIGDAVRYMERGCLMLSPQVDTEVHCGDATVRVVADSVALLVAFDGGVAVYNMHDVKNESVVVTRGTHRLTVSPGRSAIVTNRNVHYFEDVNPAEFVSYRRVSGQAYEDGIKTFQGEFNLFSLMRGVEPMKAMFKSTDARDKKVTNSVLKTAAILLTLDQSTPFTLMPAKRVTAMLDQKR